MSNRTLSNWIGTLLILFYATFFWSQTRTNLPSYFVVVPGATEVHHTAFSGRDQISFLVRAEYPATDVLNALSSQLKARGWKPLKEDSLNPGLPNSHVRGWTYFKDEATEPATSVRAWQADWQNSAHDVLTYRLEYRCPDDQCSSTYSLHDLSVLEIHTPAKVADQMTK